MRKHLTFLSAAAICAAMLGTAQAEKLNTSLGRQIEQFTVNDFYGQEHSLKDYADSKFLVVYFMGTECPLAKLYAPRMERMSQKYADQGVKVIGINSNRQDSITEIAAYAERHDLSFPILKDVGNELADRFGATRTPEVFILDQDRVVQYQGRIDAQYTFGFGVGYASPTEKRADLAEALDELLAGKEVSIAYTEPKGCIIGRVRDTKNDSPVTYSKEIARLFQDRCVKCHREGQIAPFTLTSYEDVAGWGEMIAEVVRDQRMPPWHANPAHGVFSNAEVLTADEKEMVYTWVENGCPEGDPAELPAPRDYPEGWMLPEEPDLVLNITPEPVDVMAEGVEPYRYYTVDPGFKEDKWVKFAECKPGNPQVVHHIIAFIRPGDDHSADAVDENQRKLTARERRELRRQRNRGRRRSRGEDRDVAGFGFLSGFAPGTLPMDHGPGMAKKIPAGSKLVFQMHYTPNGSAQTDQSSIGIVFMDDDEVTHQMSTTNASRHDFVIPANESDHKVTAEKTFVRDTLLLSMFPHMHVRGKSFKYEVFYPDGTHEVLLDVPQYDFNWQYSFVLAEPKLLPKGSRLFCTAYFDNSEENLQNPNPNEEVRWGDQTWEEMMIGWYDVAFPREEVANLLKKNEKSDDSGSDDSGE